jgi:hypothetical protein
MFFLKFLFKDDLQLLYRMLKFVSIILPISFSYKKKHRSLEKHLCLYFLFFKPNMKYILLLILAFPLFLKAELDISRKITKAWLISPIYSIQMPLGTLADRYGINHNVGISIWQKSETNWIYGVEANWIFGTDVKTPNLIGYAASSTGQPIGYNGQYVEYIANERGMMLKAQVGKIIKTWIKPNPNSGILWMGSIGYIDHRTYIDIDALQAPQFTDSYLTGYDRKCSGVMFSHFIGYIYISNNRLFNFQIGLETNIGLTKNVRNWDFVEQKKLVEKRTDVLNSIKVGFIIPLFKKGTQEEFFYH